MSKMSIAPTRGEGISTPKILTETTPLGNTFSVAAYAEVLETAITNEGVSTLEMVSERLAWIADLADASREAATEKDGAGAVNRMHTLAIITSHLADEVLDRVRADLVTLRDEHLPRLLAALPHGVDA